MSTFCKANNLPSKNISIKMPFPNSFDLEISGGHQKMAPPLSRRYDSSVCTLQRYIFPAGDSLTGLEFAICNFVQSCRRLWITKMKIHSILFEKEMHSRLHQITGDRQNFIPVHPNHCVVSFPRACLFITVLCADIYHLHVI